MFELAAKVVYITLLVLFTCMLVNYIVYNYCDESLYFHFNFKQLVKRAVGGGVKIVKFVDEL